MVGEGAFRRLPLLFVEEVFLVLKFSIRCVAALVAMVGFLAETMAQDALSQSKERGLLSVCADPYIYPYSSSGGFPRGFDIDLIEQIAARADMSIEFIWVDTGTRGGLGKALRNSISKGQCDVFTGIGIDDDQLDELEEKGLVATDPYIGVAYVLVLTAGASGANSLDDVKNKLKVGVSMSTPMDGYLFDNGIDRELYLGNRRVVDGLRNGEIEAAMVFSSAVAEERKRHKDLDITVAEGFEPLPGLRWNVAMAVPEGEDELLAFINEGIKEAIESGEMKAIVEDTYKMPYYPPFND
jgi:ABC-type amino acid transport substrate-binding protein